MLQRLTIALTQVKAGNQKLLNETSQIIYSLYSTTFKVYNNIMKSINL